MSKNLITPEQLLAHDFQPNPMFVVRDGLPGGPETCEAIQEKLNNLGVAVRTSMIFLGLTKEKLIEIAEESTADLDDFFVTNLESAKRIVDLIQAAFARHLVAMANVDARRRH
jgi:hypothetical protein